MFKFKRLDHIGLATADAERFVDFYSGILGFEVRERWTVKGNERLKEVANLSLNAPNAGEDGSIIELFSIDPDAPDQSGSLVQGSGREPDRLLPLQRLSDVRETGRSIRGLFYDRDTGTALLRAYR